MTARTAAEVLYDTTSALVREHDITDVLAHLLTDCAHLLSADSVGLLVCPPTGGDLELLSATSHRAAELEIFQARQDHGPGVDTIEAGVLVTGSGEEEIRSRWSDIGQMIVGAGYHSVRSYPLLWHEKCLGALNVFAVVPPPKDTDRLGQAIADIATLVLVQAQDLTDQEITSRIRDALNGRIVIEQAKGILAYRHGLDMERAYTKIITQAAQDQVTLTTAAEQVLHSAHRIQPPTEASGSPRPD